MPRQKIPDEPTRFDIREIGKRLGKDAERFGIPAKAIGEELWPQQKDPRFTWYKKTASRGSRFEWHEVALAVDAIVKLGRDARDRPIDRAPTLYPLVDWDLAESFDNWLKRGK